MSTGKPNFMDNKNKDEENEKRIGKPDFMDSKKQGGVKQDKESGSSSGRPDFMKNRENTQKDDGFTSLPSTTETVESEAKEAMRPQILSGADHKSGQDKELGLDMDLGQTADSEFLAEHVVKAGDNLSYISRDYYGTKDHWKTIWEANKDVIKDPNVIRPGMVLKIPRLE